MHQHPQSSNNFWVVSKIRGTSKNNEIDNKLEKMININDACVTQPNINCI